MIQTTITTRQKIVTLAGITLFGIVTSLCIGRKVIPQTILTFLVFYFLSGERPSLVYASMRTIDRDFKAAKRFIYLTIILKYWEYTNQTVASIFDKVVKAHPNKTALVMDDQIVTLQDMNTLSNKVAQYFHNNKYNKGEAVALLMETCLEYSPIWLGLSKLGVITALINCNLRKATLLHSIKVSNCKAIIVGPELISALLEVSNDSYIKNLPVFVFDKEENALICMSHINLAAEIRETSISNLNFDLRQNSPKDKILYIYTSGTTGLPKASIITNLRFMFLVMGGYVMLDLKKEDVFYNSLPLYHTAGGMVGIGLVLLQGTTMVLRKRFSASNFWSDCIKYNCTVANYIGEICRYLLVVPAKPEDSSHKVRSMLGNGLRKEIWSQFVTRFQIKHIYEFYGSTEGNSNLVNFDNTVGACGFVPHFAKSFYPVTLVRSDEQGIPLKDATGKCIRCKTGDVGVFIGKISSNAARSFSGYADKNASEKKILRNVFKSGDLYFNSGDLLVMDIFGYFYFKDRTGDTFRWKGENVATSEVEAVISNITALSDCVVYGVEIPGSEGKAGMAAFVDTNGKTDIETISTGVRLNLPPYARPVFLRILKEVQLTGTFKLKKLDLQLEGYDVTKIIDPIFLLRSDGFYRKLTMEEFLNIQKCILRI